MEDEGQIDEQLGGTEIAVGSGPDDELDEIMELPEALPVLPP